MALRKGGPPDPEQLVRCEHCPWQGKVADCDPKPDDLVRCPKCGEPVTKRDGD